MYSQLSFFLILAAGQVSGQEDVLPPGDNTPVLRVETAGPMSGVSTLAFSSDGTTLYAAGRDKIVQVWEWDEAAERFVPRAEATFRIPIGPGLIGTIDAIALSPDDRCLAVGGLGVARHQAGFFDRGRYLAPLSTMSDEMATDQGIIYVFDTRTREVRLLRGHRGPVVALTFANPKIGPETPSVNSSPSRGRGQGKGTEVVSRQALARISHRRPEQGRTLLPERRKRRQSGSHSVDVENQEKATEVPAPAAFARSGLPGHEKCGLGLGGPLLISGAVELNDRKQRVGTVRVWDVEKRQTVGRLENLPGRNVRPRLSAWHPDSDSRKLHVAIAWNDKLADARSDVLRVWEWNGDQSSVGTSTNALTDACVALPLRDQVLSGSIGQIQLWTVPSTVNSMDRNGDVAKTLALPANSWASNVVLLSSQADGCFDYAAVAVSSLRPPTASHLRIIQLDPWELLPLQIPLPGLRSAPALAASPMGQHLAATSADHREIRVYRTSDLLGERGEAQQVLRGGGVSVREVSFVQKDEHLGLLLAIADPQLDKLTFDLSASRLIPDVDGWEEASARSGPWKVTLENVPGQRQRQIVVRRPDGEPRQIAVSAFRRVTNQAVCPQTENLSVAVLAVAYDERGHRWIDLYNADTGVRLRRLSAHTEPIRSLTFSEDGRMLASTAEDRTVNLWWLPDLDETLIGKHGWLRGLEVRSPDGKLTVAAVRPTAQLALRESIEAGDVIRDVVDARGRTHTFPHRTEFYEFLWNTKRGEELTLQVVEDGGLRAVPVRVEQAVDQRLPLCSLFLSHDDQRGTWSWIAWSPLGPYEASDRAVEKLLGWHFNTGDPETPARLAHVDQYRDKFFGRGLLKRLIEAGSPPSDWPPLATPQVSLILRDEQGEPIIPDDEQRVMIRDRQIEALLQVTGSPAERVGAVTWQLDAGPPVSMDPAPERQATWSADLSAIDWQPGNHQLQVTLHTKEQHPRKYTVRQLVRFSPGTAPQPSVRGSLPDVLFVGPTTPGRPLDLCAGRDEQEVVVEARLQPAPGGEPLQAVLLVNDKVVEGPQGKPLLVTQSQQRLQATARLSPGKNRIQFGLRNPETGAAFNTDALCVTYRRPPKIVRVGGPTQSQEPFAQMEVLVESELPLTRVDVDVNGRPVPPDTVGLPKEPLTASGIWLVTLRDVPLGSQDNRVQVFAWNAEGRSLEAAIHQVQSEPVPARIDISGLPHETTLATPELDLPLRIRSSRPLKRVDLRLQNRFGDSFVFLPLPQPDQDGVYVLRHSLELQQGTNEVQLEVTDDAGNRAMAVRKLSVIAEPAFVHVDRLESGPRVIQPTLVRHGGMSFREAAPDALVAIRGRILCPDDHKLHAQRGQVVKAWVNGFLQSVTTLPPREEPERQEKFQVQVVLNRPEDNRVELEFPGLPRTAENRLVFDLDCRKPQTGQRLHLVMIGFGLSKNTDIVEHARRALQIRDGRTPVFSEVRIYGPLTGRVRATHVKYQLELFRAAAQNRFRDTLNDVLMIYYYGQEADTDQRFVLVTSENRLNPTIDDQSVITSEYLSDFLGQVHGAHLVFLDVGRPSSVRHLAHAPLAAFPRLGVLRSSWLESDSVPPDRSLPVALQYAQEAEPQAYLLKEVAGELAAVYNNPSLGFSQSAQFNASVPLALENLVCVGSDPRQF